jgi:hypothetical protein
VILPLLKKHNVKMTPADSEHSAIFQCLQAALLPPSPADPFRKPFRKHRPRPSTLLPAHTAPAPPTRRHRLR